MFDRAPSARKNPLLQPRRNARSPRDLTVSPPPVNLAASNTLPATASPSGLGLHDFKERHKSARAAGACEGEPLGDNADIRQQMSAVRSIFVADGSFSSGWHQPARGELAEGKPSESAS
jgi:hypothetical protein